MEWFVCYAITIATMDIMGFRWAIDHFHRILYKGDEYPDEFFELLPFDRKKRYKEFGNEAYNFFFEKTISYPQTPHSTMDPFPYPWEQENMDMQAWFHEIYFCPWDLFTLTRYHFDRSINLLSPWVPRPMHVIINPYKYYPYSLYGGIEHESRLRYFFNQLLLLPKNFIYAIYLSHIDFPLFLFGESLILFYHLIEPLLELDFFNLITRWKIVYDQYAWRFVRFYLNNFDVQPVRKIDMGLNVPEYGIRAHHKDPFDVLPVLQLNGVRGSLYDLSAKYYHKSELYYEINGDEDYEVHDNLAMRSYWKDYNIFEPETYTVFWFDVYKSPVFRFRTGVEAHFQDYLHALGHGMDLDNNIACDLSKEYFKRHHTYFDKFFFQYDINFFDSEFADEARAYAPKGFYLLYGGPEYCLNAVRSFNLTYRFALADTYVWQDFLNIGKFVNDSADKDIVYQRVATPYNLYVLEPLLAVPYSMYIYYIYTIVFVCFRYLQNSRMTDYVLLSYARIFIFYHLSFFCGFFALLGIGLSFYVLILQKDVGELYYTSYASCFLKLLGFVGFEDPFFWGHEADEMIQYIYEDWVLELEGDFEEDLDARPNTTLYTNHTCQLSDDEGNISLLPQEDDPYDCYRGRGIMPMSYF